jgi:hypothetical protein
MTSKDFKYFVGFSMYVNITNAHIIPSSGGVRGGFNFVPTIREEYK